MLAKGEARAGERRRGLRLRDEWLARRGRRQRRRRRRRLQSRWPAQQPPELLPRPDTCQGFRCDDWVVGAASVAAATLGQRVAHAN